MKHRVSRVTLVLAAAGALAVNFGGARSAAAGDEPNTIVVKGFMFTPMTMTVKAGTKVTWSNRDEEPHTVTSDEGLFRSAAMDTDESFSYKFDKPGTFHYTCSIHPRMIGTITVE